MKLLFIAKFWLPLVFVTTVLCGLMYLLVQQNVRMSANDPQIQMAEDAAVALSSGVSPEALVGNTKVNMAVSLAPFLIVYNTRGEVITSGAILHGSIPTLPGGVLTRTQQSKENRLTWQPEIGVREAIVVVSYNNGYVLAGRSLKEVEVREDHVLLYTTIAWITSLVGSFVLISFFSFLHPAQIKK